MDKYGKFTLKVMNPDRKIFEGEVSSVFLPGDQGEFELLPYHYPLLSLLGHGEIIIDWEYSIPINHGIVKFFKNDCVILCEIDEFAYIEIPSNY